MTRSGVLALFAVGCTTVPAAMDGAPLADATADARDAGPPRMDAYVPPYDAGPSDLETSGDTQFVTSACSSRPRLAWNGAGWAIWWPDGCDAIQEIDASGVPGARLALTALPVDHATFDAPVRLDAVVFAHGAYGLAARQCARTGRCSDEHFASLARSGTAAPWVAAAPGDFLGLAGWDDRSDWVTVEAHASGVDLVTVTSVLRDASFASTSELDLDTTNGTVDGDVYQTAHTAIAWWELSAGPVRTTRARPLAPDGTALGAAFEFPYFIDDVGALDDTLLMLDVLPYAFPTPPPRGIAVLDPVTGVEATRSPIGLIEQVNAPRIAVVPELALAGLCWTHPRSTAQVDLYVQLFDLVTHALVGVPTRVPAGAPDGHDCGWSGTDFVVVWGGSDTRTQAYRVTR